MFHITRKEFHSNINKRIHKDIDSFENLSFKKPDKIINDEKYYLVPTSNNNIMTSRVGKCYKVLSDYFLKNIINDKGYVTVAYSIKTIRYHYSIHRLLALTFIPRPLVHCDKDYSELQVNHIDGNTSNNTLTNLEWCIQEENMQHATDHLKNALGINVVIFNMLNKETIHFPSINACARFLEVSNATLFDALKRVTFKFKVKDWLVKTLLDDISWTELEKMDLCELGEGQCKTRHGTQVKVTDLATDEVNIFISLTKAYTHVGCTETTFIRNIHKGPYYLNGYKCELI